MSRMINQRVKVVTDDNGRPTRFLWDGVWRSITDIVEEWKETGCWWRGEGETLFYLVVSSDLGSYELSVEDGRCVGDGQSTADRRSTVDKQSIGALRFIRDRYSTATRASDINESRWTLVRVYD